MDILKKNEKEIDKIIDHALKEDIGAGDITTEFVVPVHIDAIGDFAAKTEGIICGLPLIKKIFLKLDPKSKVTYKKKDGDRVKAGDILALVKGNARAILMGERVALNFMQQLSGIATLTHKFVERASHYGVEILDTRKTTPTLRILEKYAVVKGGGKNHRLGLYDMVLIKDNHLRLSTIEEAVKNVRRYLPRSIKIEIEVDNLQQLDAAIPQKPDIIMLDNFSLENIDKAMQKLKGKGIKVEISGGINLSNIGDFARKRPDFISIGAITHSNASMDISFHFYKKQAKPRGVKLDF
ncbi:MAG: carboxylating nicotinate-nucleotide diphosphorylase [bacterium]